MLALISNGEVVETRDIALDDVPPHKRDLWKHIEGDEPAYNKATHVRTGPTYQIESDRVLRVWQLTPRDLALVKASAKARISNDAETARGRYLTPGSGKAMSYQQVAAEAVRYKAAGGVGEYPFLQARVASGRYMTLADAAAATLAVQAQWSAIGAEIDRIEDGAKIDIDAARTVDEVSAIQPSFDDLQPAQPATITADEAAPLTDDDNEPLPSFLSGTVSRDEARTAVQWAGRNRRASAVPHGDLDPALMINLTTISHLAKSGQEGAFTVLAALAEAQGVPLWQDVADDLIRKSDAAMRIAVRSYAVEIEALRAIDNGTDEQVGAIRDAAIAAIKSIEG